ncbi:hypothetical protein LWI29_017382 [Acer saccharum]|uniref:Uncharacterized protein n=1 Tax=Acer saccharum TaxID=4024 RepID=A0AA39VTK7_ACESA|nr:hypothetical protein LWI29_017382 [Acer saccharum]
MGDTKLMLKLLIDTKCQTVVFAEAGKDFFDSIFKTLSDFGISTVGNVVLHLQETGEEDCFNNFLKSIEKLSETEMQPDESKSNSLSLQYPSGQTTCSIEFPILLSDLMTRKSAKTNLRDEAGFGNGLATYMVMDDLEVKHMSTKSFIDLFDKFNIKDASVLQERVVNLRRGKSDLLLHCSSNLLHSSSPIMARGGATGAGRGNGGKSAANSGVVDGDGNRYMSLNHSNFERSLAEDSTNPYFLSNGDHPGLNRREKSVCSHYGLVGHVVDKCYKLHGFPPGFKFRNRVSDGKPVVSQTSANYDISEDTSVVHASHSVSNLSPNQCQQIIALLSSQLQQTTTTHQSIEDQQPIISNFTGVKLKERDVLSERKSVSGEDAKEGGQLKERDTLIERTEVDGEKRTLDSGEGCWVGKPKLKALLFR